MPYGLRRARIRRLCDHSQECAERIRRRRAKSNWWIGWNKSGNWRRPQAHLYQCIPAEWQARTTHFIPSRVHRLFCLELSWNAGFRPTPVYKLKIDPEFKPVKQAPRRMRVELEEKVVSETAHRSRIRARRRKPRLDSQHSPSKEEERANPYMRRLSGPK